MSGTETLARPGQAGSADAGKEPVWVFESQLGIDIGRGAAAIARKCRGAGAGEHEGATGANYALPTRDAEGALLAWNEIANRVTGFFEFASRNPDTRFLVLPSPARKPPADFERFAELFRHAPPNCELPGRMLEYLDRMKAVRIIILDSNITIIEDERQRVLDHYFTANEGLWNADVIEIISIGSPHTLVANDRYAKRRGYRHRIIGADKERYGDYASQVRELLSIAYATKLLSMNDPTGTSTNNVIGALQLAAAAGLEIDEILIQ